MLYNEMADQFVSSTHPNKVFLECIAAVAFCHETTVVIPTFRLFSQSDQQYIFFLNVALILGCIVKQDLENC